MSEAKGELGGFTAAFKSSAGSIAGIAGLLGAGALVVGFASMTKSAFETIAATDRMANSLGISTQALSQLHYAAKLSGVSAEELDKGIIKLDKNLNEAAQTGTGPAAKAFETLGLSAKKLINDKPEDAIAEIADALATIENPAQRAATAQEIFGKAAVELLPLLAQGSDGIKKLSAEADKLGVSFNGVDATQIEEANKAIERMKSVIEGAINKLAISMAPFIEALANKLTDLGTQGRGLGGILVNAFEAVVKGVAAGCDYLELFKAAWYGLKAAAMEAFSLMERGIQHTLEGLEWLAEKLGKSHTGWGDSYKAEADSLEQGAVEAFNKAGESYDNFTNGKNSAKAAHFFDQIRKDALKTAQTIDAAKPKMKGLAVGLDSDAKALEKVASKLADMQKEVDQFNLTKAQKAADDVGRIGGTDADKARASALAEQLDDLEALKKAQDEMASDAKKLWGETTTPLEKYGQQLDKLNALYDAGMISEDTYARGAIKAQKDLAKATQQKDFEAPKVLTQGSAEAASFIAKIQSQEKGGGIQDKILQTQVDSYKQLQTIADNTKTSSTGPQFTVADFV